MPGGQNLIIQKTKVARLAPVVNINELSVDNTYSEILVVQRKTGKPSSKEYVMDIKDMNTRSPYTYVEARKALYLRGQDDPQTRITDPINGIITYNTTRNKFEGYEDGSWKDVITSGGGSTLGEDQIGFGNASGNLISSSNLIYNGTDVVIGGSDVVVESDIGSTVQAFDSDLLAIANLSSNGILIRTGSGTAAARTLTGTSNRLSVTNGNGVGGNPTIDISTNYIGQETISTLGTINIGTWQGDIVVPEYGGTGMDNSSLATDRYLYTNGVGTFTSSTITSFARSLLDDIDAATARTTLDVDQAGTINLNNISDDTGNSLLLGNLGTAGNVTLTAQGSDSNIDVIITPKGTGKISTTSSHTSNISAADDIVTKGYADANYDGAGTNWNVTGTTTLTGNVLIDGGGVNEISFGSSTAGEKIDLFSIYSDDTIVLDSTGAITSNAATHLFSGPDITSSGTDDYNINITRTLNDATAAGGSDVYRGIKMDITRTDVTGWDDVYLIDLASDATSRFNVTADGDATIVGSLTVDNLLINTNSISNATGAVQIESVQILSSTVQTIGGTVLNFQSGSTGDVNMNFTATGNGDFIFNAAGTGTLQTNATHTSNISAADDVITKGYADSNYATGGNVTKVGTPVNNQVAVWTGDGTIEGTSNLTVATGGSVNIFDYQINSSTSDLYYLARRTDNTSQSFFGINASHLGNSLGTDYPYFVGDLDVATSPAMNLLGRTDTDTGSIPVSRIQSQYTAASGSALTTRPVLGIYNYETLLYEIAADGTGDYQGNNIININEVQSDAITSYTTNANLTLSGNGTGGVVVSDDLDISGNISKTGILTIDATTGIDLAFNSTTELSVESGLVEVQNDLEVLGDVGINGSIASSPLHIKADASATSYQNGVRINANSDGSTIRAALTVTNGDDGRILLYDNATSLNIRLDATTGILSVPTYSTTVGGTNRDLFIDNTGLIGYVSSIRESKMNIKPLENIDWLYNLDVKSFNYRKKDSIKNYTDDYYDELEYGLIAEEVEKINPELVFYDVDSVGTKELRGVSYSKLVPVLVKALQEQQEQIQNQQKMILRLEKRVKQLEDDKK